MNGEADAILSWNVISLRQVPSPTVVGEVTEGIEQFGVIYVLVGLVLVLGGLALRTMFRTEAELAAEKKKNAELSAMLMEAVSEVERGGGVAARVARRRRVAGDQA